MTDSKILICVFSYEREHLLKNAVRSIDTYFPTGDRMVCDDASQGKKMRDYLGILKDEGRWQVYVNPDRKARAWGGLYSNMKYALNYALDNNYDICLWLEDDAQFVWHKPDYIKYVESVFATCDDAIELCPWFSQRYRSPYYLNEENSVGRRMEYVPEIDAYRSYLGFNSSGFINLNVIRKYPDFEFYDQYGGALPWISGYWLNKKYFVYYEAEPTVVMIPWLRSVYNGTQGIPPLSESPGASGFIAKPLSADEVTFMKERPHDQIAYQEYFNFSTENVERPTWHRAGEGLNYYYLRCATAEFVEDSDFSNPRRVPIVSLKDPIGVDPKPNHVRRYQQMMNGLYEIEKTGEVKTATNVDEVTKEDILIHRSFARRLCGFILPGFIRQLYAKLEEKWQNRWYKLQRIYGNEPISLIKNYVLYLKFYRRLRKEQKQLPYPIKY